MDLEYLLVDFKDDRNVFANDVLVGETNQVLMLQPGGYEIRLDGDGYTPPTRIIDLSGTTIVQPMVVSFT